MSKKPLQPEDVRQFLSKRFANQHKTWLVTGGEWPLSVTLGAPTENGALADPAGVRAWAAAWATWSRCGEVTWETRQWPRLGTQRLPTSLVLGSAMEVAEVIGQAGRWKTASERYEKLVSKWPSLDTNTGMGRHFAVLADYSSADFDRLISMVEYLVRNPASGHYVRQLPVEGLDTKWLGSRTGLVADLLCMLRPDTPSGDFHAVCGLRRPAHRLRIRILCPELRRATGGLCDIEAPVDELASLSVRPMTTLIVENLETGLALPDLRGVVAIMKLGKAVSALGALPWIRYGNALYWGDIDTHGFEILDRARQAVPQLQSVLMDVDTLLAFRSLCVEESAQATASTLPNLGEGERAAYTGLKANQWGHQLRLEQERLPWNYSIGALREAMALELNMDETR